MIKMKDKSKRLTKHLDTWFISHSGAVSVTQEDREAFKEIRQIIKQQPKIDEIYINEKARQLHEASWTGATKKARWVIGIKEARSFIGFIVSEVLGFGKKEGRINDPQ